MHNVDIFGNQRPPQSSHQGTDDIMIFTINDKNSDFMSMGIHEHYCTIVGKLLFRVIILTMTIVTLQ